MTRSLLVLSLLSITACADLHRATLEAPRAQDATESVDTPPAVLDDGVDEAPVDATPVEPEEEPVSEPEATSEAESTDVPDVAHEEPSDEEPMARPWTPQGDFPVLVAGTWLQGRFGRATAVNMAPTQIDGWVGEYGMSYTLHTIGEDWTMFDINISGIPGEGHYTPGSRVYFSADIADDTGVVVPESVWSCSGPALWDYTADLTVDDVVIDVSLDDDRHLVMQVDADFGYQGNLTATLVFE